MKEAENLPGFWESFFWALPNRIPLSARIWFFRRLADLAYGLDERHRRIALRNLAVAFPERDEAERRRIAREAFRHLGTVFAEFPFIPRLDRQRIENYIQAEGVEEFRKAKGKNRGLLLFTAHFGNWEWMAAAFPFLVGHPLAVVFRPIDSPFLDRLVARLRGWCGRNCCVAAVPHAPRDNGHKQAARM